MKKANTTDFMVSGDLSYCGLNHGRKTKVDDNSRYLTIVNPIITNPWNMNEDTFNVAQKLLTAKLKTDPDTKAQFVVIGVKGDYPIRAVYDKATKATVKLPTEVDENGEQQYKEPIDTHVDIDVKYLHSEDWDRDFFTFAGMQVPDASKLKYYERSETGLFGQE